jgi:hypothetical protein
MASRLFAAALAATVLVTLGVTGSTGTVSAHEHRTVAENYEFVVGWKTEPSIGEQPNAVWISVHHFEGGVPEEHEGEEAEGEAVEGTPVEGVEETLAVAVSTGGGAESIDLELGPAFGEEGVYESTPIIPAPGDYTFTFTGTLPDGTEVNEAFESSPDTFDSVEDPAEIQFPAATAAADSDASASSDSDSNGDTALIVAIIAIVAALIAAGIAIYGLSRSRS